jgi:chemotaxis protein CheZ
MVTPSTLSVNIELRIKACSVLTWDSFTQMSFQDLTGQRIERIILLVNQMEEMIREMVISSGIKLQEIEKNPRISTEALGKAVDEKITELAGPQKEVHGLDQDDIDELLASL